MPHTILRNIFFLEFNNIGTFITFNSIDYQKLIVVFQLCERMKNKSIIAKNTLSLKIVN